MGDVININTHKDYRFKENMGWSQKTEESWQSEGTKLMLDAHKLLHEHSMKRMESWNDSRDE